MSFDPGYSQKPDRAAIRSSFQCSYKCQECGIVFKEQSYRGIWESTKNGMIEILKRQRCGSCDGFTRKGLGQIIRKGWADYYEFDRVRGEESKLC